ncbi:MAG: hypothetical protein IJW78_05255 [Clostridia bacterium]|nr:hypothetical protein [Clostridia bacterium]
MEEKRTCTACGTENREDFQFCKNCGAKLPEAAPAPAPAPVAPPFYAPDAPTEEPSELDKLSAFIGTNGYERAQKMLSMRARAKKASWNWPVFLFGFFLGLPFVWFYYRKMYKQGTAVLLVTLAILLGTVGCAAGFLSPIFDAVATIDFASVMESDDPYSTVVGYTTADNSDWLNSDFEDSFEDGFRSGAGEDISDEQVEKMLSVLGPKFPKMVFCILSASLLSVANLVFIILLSVYADNIYKNHCEKKLALLKVSGQDELYALRNAGGTSTLAAVLSGILFTVGTSILSVAIVFSSMAPLFSLFLLD